MTAKGRIRSQPGLQKSGMIKLKKDADTSTFRLDAG